MFKEPTKKESTSELVQEKEDISIYLDAKEDEIVVETIEDTPILETIQDEPTEEIEEVETIVDEVIKETINKEEIKAFEKMESEKPMEDIRNLDVLKEALINRDYIRENKHTINELRAKENFHFIEIMKELHFIKKHVTKFALGVLIIVYMAGYVTGTQHKDISPFISKGWDLISILKPQGY